MTKIRILGSYKGKEAEEIDTAQSPKEAADLVAEYRLAYGKDWSLWVEGENGEAP